MATRKLLVEVVGDDRSLQQMLGRSRTATEGFGHAIGRVAKTAALAAGAAGVGALAVTLKAGYDEWRTSATVSAQTEAVLKSTSHVANECAEAVSDLANALMRKSGVDDDAIQSGENMLLTFTNIRNEAGQGNDIFNRTTKTLLDMTVAMNHGNVTQENMAKQAIQLGKAMNDPIKGLSALRRVGVTFTEGQQATIKKLVESGHTMEAQKLILKELNKEFGGSAEALGKTLPGQINIARETFRNLSGELFTKLIPALTAVLGWVNTHWPQIERVMSAVFQGIAWAIKNVAAPALKYLVEGIRFVVDWTREHWAQISAIVKTVLENVKSFVMFYVHAVEALWGAFGSTIITMARNAWDYVKNTIKNAMEVIRGVIDVIAGLIHGDWGRVWKGITEIVGGAVRQIWNTLRTAVRQLGAVASLVGHAIWEGLKAGGTAVINWVIGQLNHLVDAYNKVLGWLTGNINAIPTIGGGPAAAAKGLTGPAIPGHAAGGIFTMPHLAWIAEKGPEAVIPLSAGGSHLPSAWTGRGGGEVTFNVTLHAPNYLGDKHELGEIVVNELSKWARRNGNTNLRAVLGATG